MNYKEFESIMSTARMSRYKKACSGKTREAMTLYRLNLKLSQEFFTVVSCFEIAIRNKINSHFLNTLGKDWLRDGIMKDGIFDNKYCKLTNKSIKDSVKKLGSSYTHNKLVAELGFGFWRFLFAQRQYSSTGKNLLKIFVNKPMSTPTVQYNQKFVFNKLAEINSIRNRIAHHEPICFKKYNAIKDSNYARQIYLSITQLFQWLNINHTELLYGIDHINKMCNKLDDL